MHNAGIIETKWGRGEGHQLDGFGHRAVATITSVVILDPQDNTAPCNSNTGSNSPVYLSRPVLG